MSAAQEDPATLETAALEIDRLPLSDNPPKETKLNANHKRFIRYRAAGLSRTDAYMKAYNITDEDLNKLAEKRRWARNNASRLVNENECVRKAIAKLMDESMEAAQSTLALEMEEAAATIAEIRKSGTKEDGVRLRAAEYIIDRGLGKPKTSLDVDQTIHSDLNITLKLPEDLDIDKLI